MSLESAILFAEKTSTNLEFRERVEACPDVEQLHEFIVKEGFDFKGKELKEAYETLEKQYNEKCNGELSDDELEKVTGGIISVWLPCGNSSTSSECVMMNGK